MFFFYWQHPAERRTFFFFAMLHRPPTWCFSTWGGAGRGIRGLFNYSIDVVLYGLLRNVHQLMSNCVYAVGECSNVKWLWVSCIQDHNVSYLVFTEWKLCPRARLDWAETNRRPVRKRDLWLLCAVMAYSNYSNLSRAQLTFEYLHTNS